MSFTLDEALAESARLLDINVSAAAREGVTAAVRVAQAEADRSHYRRAPDSADPSWNAAEQWGDE